MPIAIACLALVTLNLLVAQPPARASRMAVPINCSGSIQACIDAANEGDTILIAAGRYTESLTLSKAVSLTGVSSDSTIFNSTFADVVSNPQSAIAVYASSTLRITNTIITSHTLFVAPLHDYYRLQFGSAAIDHDTNVGVYTDLDGNPRPIGPGFAIGAHEYDGPTYWSYLPLIHR